MYIRTRLSVMMFLQFFIWGAFFVTLGGYLGVIFAEYAEKGELNTIIGDVYATQPWAALFAPLIVGFVADRLFNKERVNGVLQILGGIVLWYSATVTDSPKEFFWVMLVYFLLYMPTLALVNHSVDLDHPGVANVLECAQRYRARIS